jgi:hypothetical protein
LRHFEKAQDGRVQVMQDWSDYLDALRTRGTVVKVGLAVRQIHHGKSLAEMLLRFFNCTGHSALCAIEPLEHVLIIRSSKFVFDGHAD